PRLRQAESKAPSYPGAGPCARKRSSRKRSSHRRGPRAGSSWLRLLHARQNAPRDFRNGSTTRIPRNYFDRVPDFQLAFVQNGEVEAGAQRAREAAHHVLAAEADAELEAGQA